MTKAEEHMKVVCARWAEALQGFQATPELAYTAEAFVDDFFRRHPCERTPLVERFITALAIDYATSLPADQLLRQPKAA